MYARLYIFKSEFLTVRSMEIKLLLTVMFSFAQIGDLNEWKNELKNLKGYVCTIPPETVVPKLRFLEGLSPS